MMSGLGSEGVSRHAAGVDWLLKDSTRLSGQRSRQRSAKSEKTRPVSEPLRNGAQTTNVPVILAMWATTSPGSASQNTNQGSPSSVTPLSVSRKSPAADKTFAARCKYASSYWDQPRRSARPSALGPHSSHPPPLTALAAFDLPRPLVEALIFMTSVAWLER